MASREELLAALHRATPDEPVAVLVRDLGKLAGADVPESIAIDPCTAIEDRMRVPAIEGTIEGDKDGSATVVVDYRWMRKLWDAPLGVVEYLTLVKRAIDARQRTRADVELHDAGEDEEHAWLTYAVRTGAEQCDSALDYALRAEAELREVAEAVSAGVESTIEIATRRIAGWGTQPLDRLVDEMRSGTPYEKGLRLEELTTRLFDEVPGFRTSGRVLTETEEIDFTVQNASDQPVWRRESALVLGECKNWSGVCGRAEFSTFKDKMRGRVGRVSCGFLVSWNGFAETIEKQMLRGSEGDLLVVPITGEDLRGAVRDGDFPTRLERLHQQAVLL
jgi:hypothetical protein